MSVFQRETTVKPALRTNRALKAVLLATVIGAVLVSASYAARSGGRQSTRAKDSTPVKPTIRKTPVRSNATAVFAPAAERNIVLRDELSWTFGGKQQRGWYLYDLLVGKTLDTASEAVTNDFAAALAGWQKKKGLSAVGELDEESLMAMISQWQSNRLKDKTPAEPDQLLIAPAEYFYDPQRIPELRQVERKTFDAYQRMVAAAMADSSLKLQRTASGDLAPSEKYFKIISAFRSREYQEQLRRQSPNAGSAGLAVNSPHFTGRALDIYVGGDPVDTRDTNRATQVKTPVYKWLVRNAERFGFRPYFYEPWHWEYVK